MTERSGALQEDLLYMSYAQIAARSCGEEEEEGGDEEGGEEGESSGASIHVSYRQLLAQFDGYNLNPFGRPAPSPQKCIEISLSTILCQVEDHHHQLNYCQNSLCKSLIFKSIPYPNMHYQKKAMERLMVRCFPNPARTPNRITELDSIDDPFGK